MRLLLAAFAALLCCPAGAAAAPWAEPPFQPLSGDRAATCLHTAGADRVALVASDADEQQSVELLRVAAGGALVPDGTVPFGVSAGCPGVAAAASGAAVVAAQTFTDRGGMFRVAMRDAGGDFGPRQRISVPRRAFVTDIEAAVASSGAAVVIWMESRGDAERLRYIRRAAGGAFGAPHTLRDRIDPFTDPVVGIDDAGRATVAWSRNVARGRQALEVATAPGAAFGAPQRLTRAGFVVWLSLTVAGDGGALLGYDNLRGVRFFERVPGAALMTRGPAYSGYPTRERPAVALAPGGGAILTWLRQGRDPEAPDTSVEVALRAPGGTFGPPQALSARVPGGAAWRAFGPLPTFDALEQAGALQAAVGADGTAVVGWLESRAPNRVGLAAGTLSGGWEGTTLLGGLARSADGLAVLAAPAAVLWTDNLVDFVSGEAEPDRSGRLHRAVPAGVPPPDRAAPTVRLRARRQRVRSGDPVVVTAHCSAACDLRAVPQNAHGAGAAELDGPGTTRIELFPTAGEFLAPRRGRALRVTVTATAPGGRRATIVRIDVRVRRDRAPSPG